MTRTSALSPSLASFAGGAVVVPLSVVVETGSMRCDSGVHAAINNNASRAPRENNLLIFMTSSSSHEFVFSRGAATMEERARVGDYSTRAVFQVLRRLADGFAGRSHGARNFVARVRASIAAAIGVEDVHQPRAQARAKSDSTQRRPHPIRLFSSDSSERSFIPAPTFV